MNQRPWFITLPIAHRGLHSGREVPENSLSAFAAACEAGFAIELDCHYHQMSGEIIVFHDDDLVRLAQDSRAIQDVPLHELLQVSLYEGEQTIITLDQVLELVQGEVPLLVELKLTKSSGMFEKTLVEKMDAYHQRYGGEWALQSFHHGALYWIQRRYPHVIKGLLSGSMQGTQIPGWQRLSIRKMALLPMIRPQFIAYEARALILARKDLFWRRTLGIPILAWTVRSKKEYKSLAGRCDNIIFENFIPELE
jgi:glycerophosphoryl diester phosphodiesterase